MRVQPVNFYSTARIKTNSASKILAHQAKDSVSFRAVSVLCKTPSDYRNLSDMQKDELMNKFLVAFHDNYYFHPRYRQTHPKFIDDFISTAEEIAKNYKDRRIISVGRSPCAFLETAMMIPNGIEGYIKAPFSGSWYSSLNNSGKNPIYSVVKGKKPSIDNMINYGINCLEAQGITPEIIINDAIKKNKTVIIDYIESGASIVSFIDVLTAWFRNKGYTREQLLNSIDIVAIGKPTMKKIEGINIKTVGKEDYGSFTYNNDQCDSAFCGEYPSNQWAKNSPPYDKEGSNAHLVRFRLMDYLSSIGQLRNDK